MTTAATLTIAGHRRPEPVTIVLTDDGLLTRHRTGRVVTLFQIGRAQPAFRSARRCASNGSA